MELLSYVFPKIDLETSRRRCGREKPQHLAQAERSQARFLLFVVRVLLKVC